MKYRYDNIYYYEIPAIGVFNNQCEYSSILCHSATLSYACWLHLCVTKWFFKINVHSNGFIDNSTAATTIRAAVKE
jgi:hypothetical protein